MPGARLTSVCADDHERELECEFGSVSPSLGERIAASISKDMAKGARFQQ